MLISVSRRSSYAYRHHLLLICSAAIFVIVTSPRRTSFPRSFSGAPHDDTFPPPRPIHIALDKNAVGSQDDTTFLPRSPPPQNLTPGRFLLHLVRRFLRHSTATPHVNLSTSMVTFLSSAVFSSI